MDTSSQLPEDVQNLLRERIHAVEELEALLLLFGQPARFWNESEIANELRVSPQLISAAVAALLKRDLVRRTDTGTFTFGSDNPEIERAVGELARCYQDQRVEILVFISQSAITRVRHGALRTFAEAFQFSRRK